MRLSGRAIANKLTITEMPVYADNAAAVASGLVAVGETYRTPTGVAMVRF